MTVIDDARLVHDLGKYITRTARNLPRGNVGPALVAMLARDLYETQPGRRASALFAELVPHGLEDVRTRLAEIDRLEPRVREGDAFAVRRAAELALQVEARVRAHAKRP